MLSQPARLTDCEASPTKQIPAAFTALGVAVSELEACIDRLLYSLEPALDQNAKACANGSEIRPSYSCEVAQGVDATAQRLLRLVAAVNSASARLEL